MNKFKFGDRVRRIGFRDVFLVTGYQPNGQVQLAAFNWGTTEKPEKLERA
jgi:hypothetical protein